MTISKLTRLLCTLLTAGFLDLKNASAADAAAYQLQSLSVQPGAMRGEFGRRLDITLAQNFLVLDLDRDFLRPYRQQQPKEKLTGYNRFTGVGMLILSAVNFARDSADPAVLARKDYLVAEIIKTQSASGYIGLFAEETDGAQLWTEYSFHEAAYLAYGLAEDYRYFHRPGSLEAARRLADYLIEKWPHRTPGNNFTTLGMAEACLSLYDLTKDASYLRFAADEPMGRRYRIKPAPLAVWQQDLQPPVPLSKDEMAAQPNLSWKVDTVHIYRLLATAMMQLRLDRVEPRENLPVMAHRVVDGMTRPEKAAMLVTGSVASVDEVWDESQLGQGKVVETCANIYELWFFDELLRREGNLRYGDIIERTLYNAVFGAQDAKGRQICYFTPFSGKREFFKRDTNCCPNNFRRGIAALPELIYYQSKSGVTVNLYDASQVETVLEGNVRLQLRQETAYPSSDEIVLRIDPSSPAHFSLRLRIPRWCNTAEISLNGNSPHPAPANRPFYEIDREWKAGDSVKLRLPMIPRWIQGRQIQAGKAALLCGPLVFGLNPELNPAVRNMTLRNIIIDPASVSGPLIDRRIRPDGTSYHVRAWSPDRPLSQSPDLDLLLTEFADTGNEETYFGMSDPGKTARDELIEFKREESISVLP